MLALSSSFENGQNQNGGRALKHLFFVRHWLNAWRDSATLVFNVHTRVVAPATWSELVGPIEECRPIRLNALQRFAYALAAVRIPLPQSANAANFQPTNESQEERQNKSGNV